MTRYIKAPQIIKFNLSSTLGYYIFIIPLIIIKLCKSKCYTILAVLISGILSTFIAVCYAELGALFPSSAGDYDYLKDCYGLYVAKGYSVLSCLLVCPLFISSSSIVIVNMKYFGSLTTIMTNGLLLCLFLLNVLCVDVSIYIQNILSVLRIGMITVFCCIVGYLKLSGKVFSVDRIFYKQPKEPLNYMQLIKNIGVCACLYDGFHSANFISYKVKNPRRSFYVGILTTMALTISFYVFLLCICFSLYSTEDLVNTNSDSDLINLICDQVRLLKTLRFAKIFRFLTLLGAMNMCFTIIKVVGENILDDKKYKLVFPVIAFISCVVLGFFNSFSLLMAFVSLLCISFYLLSVCSLILRREKGNKAYRVGIGCAGLIGCFFGGLGLVNYIKTLLLNN